MADIFDQIHAESLVKGKGDVFDQIHAESAQKLAFKQPEGSAVKRAAGGFLETTVGGLKSAAKMAGDLALSGAAAATGIIRPPSQETQTALASIPEEHKEQARKSGEAWRTGRTSEALGHGLAAALPFVGPAAANAAERIGGSAPTFDKFGNVIEQGRAPDIAGGLGEAAGLAVSASPRNLAKPLGTAIAKGASKIPLPERLNPEGLYQSSLRPSLSEKNLPRIKGQVATGLREGITVDRGGLAKTDAAIDSINADIAERLQGKSEQLGPTIKPLDVAKRTNQTRPTFEQQVNPEADIAAINKSKQEFLRKHTTEAPFTKIAPSLEGSGYADVGRGVTKTKQPLTLSEAQAEKQGTYKQLRKKYGELGSADIEAQKALARGLKEEIVKRVPELADLNAREGGLIELQTQLEKMVAREGNKNVLGLVPATMAHNPYGFLATLVMDNPAIKSRIAIALDRLRRNGPSPQGVGSAAVAAAPASVIGSSAEDRTPRFAKGGIAGRHGPETVMVGDGGEPEAIIPLSHIRSSIGPQAQRRLLKGIGSHLGIGKQRKSTLGEAIAHTRHT